MYLGQCTTAEIEAYFSKEVEAKESSSARATSVELREVGNAANAIEVSNNKQKFPLEVNE